MSDVITIFILIGIAHWAAHIIQCHACRKTIGMNIDFGLDGIAKTFGWPFAAFGLLKESLKPKPAPSAAQVDFGELERRLGGQVEVIELKMEKGESVADFQKRAAVKVNEIMEARRKAAEKKGEENGKI